MRLGAVLAAGALAVGGLVVAVTQRDLSGRDEERLRAAILADSSEFDRRFAAECLTTHPVDYLSALLVGVWEVRSGEGPGLRWFNWSLRLNPDHAVTHLWVARSLAHLGRAAQALLEYRIAADLDHRLVGRVARETVARWRRDDVLLALFDEQSPNLALWDAVSMALERVGASAESASLDRTLLARIPGHVPAVRRQVRRALRDRDIDRAEGLIRGLEGEAGEVVLLRAEVEAAAGRPASAVQLVERALGPRGRDRAMIEALARYRAQAGDIDGAEAAYDRLERIVGRAGLTRVLLLRASMEERAGRDSAALSHYQRAATMGGGRPAVMGMVRILERRGELTRALSVLRRFEARSVGESEEIRARETALRRRIERARLKGLLGDRHD